MLVLSRKLGEEILIGDSIVIRVVDVVGGRVRLGVEAPQDVEVDRREVRESKDRDRQSIPAPVPPQGYAGDVRAIA